jgi:hypothetical protein
MAMTNTLPPPIPTEVPVVPNPPSARKRWTILAVVAAAIVIFAGILTAVSTSEPKIKANVAPGFDLVRSNYVEVSYTVTLLGETCRMSNNGYDDIPYGEAEIFDGSGHLLGYGSMDGGVQSNGSCFIQANFTVERSGDGMYRATVGNTFRGYLNYSEADVVDDVLIVDATLGD